MESDKFFWYIYLYWNDKWVVKYKLLDMDVLNSLIREYKYIFKVGNDCVFNLEVCRDINVYIFNRILCKSDILLC